jgi:hypothetical protein
MQESLPPLHDITTDFGFPRMAELALSWGIQIRGVTSRLARRNWVIHRRRLTAGGDNVNNRDLRACVFGLEG